jgi:ubiquinone/menaquinone biosynthesis C-methylase UbiE
MGDTLRLDIGSGHAVREGYVRVDGDTLTNPDILCDVRKIPLEDSCADEVFASHILEHFAPTETFNVIMEWKRLLKPHGLITIKVPDVGHAMKGFLNGTLGDCCLMKAVFGGDPLATSFMAHKNLFWASKLERFLFITGFTDIKNETLEMSSELTFTGVKPNVESRVAPRHGRQLVRETSCNGVG